MQKTNLPLSKCKLVAFLVTLITAFLNLSCSKNTPNSNNLVITTATASSNENIETFKIGVIATQSFEEQQKMIKPLEEYLQQSLETGVNFQVASNYQQIVQWLVDGKIDMAYLTAVSYLEVLDAGAEIEPLVAPINKFTGRLWYRAAIVVKTDSNIKTLQQLKNKRFAFANKYSTSGYLIPFAALSELGINQKQDFKQVVYLGTDAKVLAALENDDIDAVAINVPYFQKQLKIGKLDENKFRVIWESPPIPPSLIVVSKKLPKSTIKQLKISFLNTSEGIEDIFGVESLGYTSVEDADYNQIRILRAKLNGKPEVVR